MNRILFFLTTAAFAQNPVVIVDAAPGHAINSFDPDQALGSSIDVLSRTGIDKVYTPHVDAQGRVSWMGRFTSLP